MTFTPIELWSVLNYDTHCKKTFTDLDRCAIHYAISHRLSYSTAQEVESRLAVKIVNALGEIRDTDYKHVNAIYFVNKETRGVELKTMEQ